MVSKSDLVERLSIKLDMDGDVLGGVMDSYIAQMESIDQQPIDPDDLSENDAEFLIEAIKSAQRSGDFGNRELGRLEQEVAFYELQCEQLDAAASVRNEAIRAAIRAGATIKDVVAVTGLSRQRIDQIKRGGR